MPELMLRLRLMLHLLTKMNFNDAANAIYKFLWDEFCDWGIELSKADKGSVKELGAIFKEAMRLLSPFMPFISEYLFHELSGSNLESANSIMIEAYPQANERNLQIKKTFELVIEAIVAIRRAKATIEQGNSKIAKAFVEDNGKLINPAKLLNSVMTGSGRGSGSHPFFILSWDFLGISAAASAGKTWSGTAADPE